MKPTAVVLFCLVLVVIGMVMLYPLPTVMDSAVPGPPGDNFEYVYKLWWFKHALFDENRSPFFVPDVFYPFGYEIALSETTLSHTILGLPLTAAFGEVVAYNLLLIWSFVLSGLGALLFTRYMTGSAVAGVIAGVVFAFLPYRLAHVAAGHLPLMGTGWLPMVLLYEERVIRNRRVRDGALAGLFFGLLALSSWYYAYMGALTVIIYGLARILWQRMGLREARLWLAGLIGIAVGLVTMLPGLLPLLSLSLRGEISRPTLSLAYVDQWSASLVDFILPSIMHPLWGDALVRLYPQNVHESILWLGALPLALAGYALLRHRTKPLVAVGIVGMCALILALGTTVHWAGEPIYVPVPAAVENAFSRIMYALAGKYALNPAAYSSLHRAGYIVLPLPALVLYLFLPFFNAMRVWARFGLIVGMAVATLAGAGGAAFLAGMGRTRRIGFFLIVGAILFDFLTVPYPFGVSAIGPQPVDEWLRDQPGDFAVLQLPPEKNWHGTALYPARVHGKQLAYGYGTYMPKAYRQWQAQVADFPADRSVDVVKEAGIRYILVGLHSYGERERQVRERLAASDRIRLVATFPERQVLTGDRLIRSVQPSAAVPPTELIGSERYAYLADEIAVYEIVR